jgi:hypothetical protein
MVCIFRRIDCVEKHEEYPIDIVLRLRLIKISGRYFIAKALNVTVWTEPIGCTDMIEAYCKLHELGG